MYEIYFVVLGCQYCVGWNGIYVVRFDDFKVGLFMLIVEGKVVDVGFLW